MVLVGMESLAGLHQNARISQKTLYALTNPGTFTKKDGIDKHDPMFANDKLPFIKNNF